MDIIFQCFEEENCHKSLWELCKALCEHFEKTILFVIYSFAMLSMDKWKGPVKNNYPV